MIDLWCAECLFELRGVNAAITEFASDEAMFDAIDSTEPGQMKNVAGHPVPVRAATMINGTLVCMPHLREAKTRRTL